MDLSGKALGLQGGAHVLHPEAEDEPPELLHPCTAHEDRRPGSSSFRACSLYLTVARELTHRFKASSYTDFGGHPMEHAKALNSRSGMPRRTPSS